ncbi:MAG: histidine--tRNA ligase [Thermoplasmata archaeon]|nr:MAG: histidine--tRNA ligase [Thermoplasmata archaeon]
MVSLSKPRGTRDFSPEEMERRRLIEKKMREVFKKYGYEEIATPTFEHLDLFTLKSGEGIIEETYAFSDKSGRMLALRPELTAPVMRFYVEKLQMRAKPLKLFYFGNCFRYDRPQSGRYREFWQMGCELIGSNQPEAIAELIALAYNVLKETGLNNVVLRIGNLDFLRSFMDKMGIANKGEVMRLIDKEEYDKLDEILGKNEYYDEFMEVLNEKDVSALKKFFSKGEIKKFEDVLTWLSSFNIPYNIDLSIARGLDYYIGIVFEIDSPLLGAEKQICGGGEYSLVPLLGGKEVPTAGFALGFDRIMLALEKEGFVFPPLEKGVYILPIGDEMRKEAVSLATELRKKGMKVEIDLMRRSIQKSLQYADKKGIKKVIILGEDEWEKGLVSIKDMDTGEQKEVKKEELLVHLER